MYYDSKFGFYIREYGAKIALGLICLLVVLSGLLIHLKLNENKPKPQVEAQIPENTEVQTIVNNDDSFLPESLKSLKTGEKTAIKIATVDNEGVVTLLTDSERIQAKLIGIDFTEVTADTFYVVNEDLQGKTVEIAFDESKAADGYAMIYVYTDGKTLYNSNILKNGKAKLSSNLSKKAVEYNNLAESQAFAKQTLAGVWEY